MDRKKFKVLLGHLAVSKNFLADTLTHDVYYKNLGNLPYIGNVLEKAVTDKYFKGFPEVSDLFQQHNIIAQAILHKKSKIEEVPKKTSALSIPRDQCAFCIDAFLHLNLSNTGVQKAIEKGRITVPFNYSKLRTKENIRDLLQQYISKELMVELRRVKSNNIFKGPSI